MVASRSGAGRQPSSYRDNGLYDPWLDREPTPFHAPSLVAAARDAGGFTPSNWMILEIVAGLAWLGLAAVAFSEVSPDLAANDRLMAAGAVLCVSWTLRSWFQESRSGDRPGWGLRAITPTIVGLGLALLASDLDLVLRLKLGEPELRRCVVEFPAGRQAHYGPEGVPIGTFRFASVEAARRWTRFRAMGREDAGLLFCWEGEPDHHIARMKYRHLSGPWWQYAETIEPAPDSGE